MKLNRRNLVLTMLICLLIGIGAPVTCLSNDLPSTSSQKIVGGADAQRGAWPWMVALKTPGFSLYDNQFCGATLIAENWVLTAAHCVSDGPGLVVPVSSLEAVVGAYDLIGDSATAERIGIKRIIVHPSYDPFLTNNDLALLELEGSSTYTPVDLVEASLAVEGMDGTVIGWGNLSGTSYIGIYPSVLQQVTVPIVTNSACRVAYDALYGQGSITDEMLCAGYAEGGKDSCDGDSGGPLVVNSNDTWKQAGIVSWGEGCAAPGYYGVYARVGEFVDWINSYIGSGNSEGNLVVYLPHVTGYATDWADYLQVDNLSAADAEFTITLYGPSNDVVYTGTGTAPALDKLIVDIKALNDTAQNGKITYSEPNLMFRLSQASQSGGGLAEFRLTGDLDPCLAFLFTGFTNVVEWKGLAFSNFGASAAAVTLSAIGDGGTLGTAVLTVNPYEKIVGSFLEWFPSVTLDQLEAVTVSSSGGSLSGVAISGDSGNTQLLFTPGAPMNCGVAP